MKQKIKKTKRQIVVISILMLNLLLVPFSCEDTDNNSNEFLISSESKKELEVSVLKYVLKEHKNIFTNDLIYLHTYHHEKERIIRINEFYILYTLYYENSSPNYIRIMNDIPIEKNRVIKYIMNDEYIGLVLYDINSKKVIGEVFGNINR